MNTIYKATRVSSPGKILIREMEARYWTQRDLANIMGRPYQAINEIVKGNKQITPDTARELAHAFGTSLDFWINLETNYRLSLAEKEKKENEIMRRSRLYSIAPIREMIKRTWINDTDDLDKLEKDVCIFLDISSLDEPSHVVASFRNSSGREPDVYAQTAWVKRVEKLAKEQSVCEYDESQLKKAIPEIFSYAFEEQLVYNVPARLNKLGIRFLIVHHLPRTYLDGAAIIHNGHPTIVLTLRYDRIDSFWFTLAHEMAHVLLGHKGIVLDDTEDHRGSLDDNSEEEANRLAQEWLVEQKKLSQFIEEVKPFFSRASIEVFAKEMGRHPGVVLGQLHHIDAVEHKYLRSMLVKVSPFLRDWTYN